MTITRRTRGYLPHWERPEGTYFATFHLDDSLPASVRERLEYQRQQLSAVKQSGRQLLPFESVLDFRLSRNRIEELLDAGSGSCLFKRPDLAKIVADALRFWDGKRCDMYAWCVRPNHVHAVFRTIPPVTLTTLLSSWKSFTVHRINHKLGRSGRIW